jgi:hypothetical protein
MNSRLFLVPNAPLGMPSVTLRVTKFDETMTNAELFYFSSFSDSNGF